MNDRTFSLRLRQLEEGQRTLGENSRRQGEALCGVTENLKLLNDTLNRLCRVLWSVAGSVFAALLGFLLWYLQQLG